MTLSSILGLKWKIGAIAAALALAAAAFFLFQAQMENRHLVTENTRLDARINDRTSGYVVQLAQATTNVKTLEAALNTQNERLREQATTSGQRLAELSATVTRIQRENQKLRTDATSLMATRPQGDTLEQRILDIDRRNLETLE